MGRKLDALLGRNFKTSKFKTLVKLAISRIAILRNQRQVRYSQARSDVIDLLNLGHQQRALLRVDHVMKEQNMLDVLVMIDNYCHLLIERVMLIHKNNQVPDELKEAITSLIFASSRCGEFPELQKLRDIFTSTFGKEFVARAIELRNNCGVNPKIVNKFSLRQPSLENRLKVLKEISSETGITLHLEEEVSAIVEVQKLKQDVDEKKKSNPNESATLDDSKLRDDTHNLSEELSFDEELSESVKGRKKYRDVAAAARDAFTSAAHAAAAARAAVELLTFESQDSDSDDHGGSTNQQGTVSDSDGSLTPNLQIALYAVMDEKEGSNDKLKSEKIQHIGNFSSESKPEDEYMALNNSEIHLDEEEENESKGVRGTSLSPSSSDSEEDILSATNHFPNLQAQNEQVDSEVTLDDIDNETSKNEGNIPWQKRDDLDSNRKPSSPTNQHQLDREYNEADDQYPSVEDRGDKLPEQSPELNSLETHDDLMSTPMERKTRLTSTQSLAYANKLRSQHRSIDWKPLSMRSR